MVERPEASAGMIKDTIQNHMHIPGMGLIQQLPERHIAAQQRVHLKIIKGVVAVIGGGGKNGIEIEGIDAQFLEIIQLIHDSMEVSPLKPLFLGRAAPRLKLKPSRVPGPGTPGETVRKNLIKDSILCPGRGVYSH
jgi:hypothetical protein